MSNPPRSGRPDQPASGPIPPATGTNPPRPAPPSTGTNPPRPAPPSTGTGQRVPVSGAPRPQADLATRLDGQRGWLNEIDRSLKKRSIIALVLTCLAVGVGAAAIYISVTKNSDADRISALETRIEALEAAGAAGGIAPTTVPETGASDPSTVVPPTGETTPLPITPSE